jgi:hypothetical protein
MEHISPGEQAASAALRESVDTNRMQVALAGESIAIIRSELRQGLIAALEELVKPENRDTTKAMIGILLDVALAVGKDRAARRAGFWIGDLAFGLLRHGALFLLIGGIIVKFFGVGALVAIWSFIRDSKGAP